MGPTNGNFARVQGTLTVNADGSITITPTNGNSAAATLTLGPNTNLTLHGITSLSNANGKAASAIYDSQSKVANQVTVNMPTPNMPKPKASKSRYGPPMSAPYWRSMMTAKALILKK